MAEKNTRSNDCRNKMWPLVFTFDWWKIKKNVLIFDTRQLQLCCLPTSYAVCLNTPVYEYYTANLTHNYDHTDSLFRPSYFLVQQWRLVIWEVLVLDVWRIRGSNSLLEVVGKGGREGFWYNKQPVLYEESYRIFFLLIPCMLQSVQSHLVTSVSIALEACWRYFHLSSPFYSRPQGMVLSLVNVV